ncbi:MAG: hypothetical protein V2I33_17055 [Kangiellaceae bacterium]|nr:hypothetical protein [Kangiellaceae bacterium]
MKTRFLIFPAGFPSFEIGNIDSLPKKPKEDIIEISGFLEKALVENEYLEISYPPNGEVVISKNENLNQEKLNKLGEVIYDFVIYGKPLPTV